MLNILRRFFISGVFAVVFLFVATPSFASTLYLSPGSANIPSGSVVYVSVGINTGGESVNGVSAYLSYPQDKLEVTSLSYGGTFSIAAEGSYGGGAIRISRGSMSGFSGQATLATIGFRGKVQGTATVAFISGSGAARTSNSTDSLNLGASSGGVYTVGAPKPGGSTTKDSSLGGTASSDVSRPVIKAVKVIDIATNSATVTWQTDEKSDSTVEYGLTKGAYILSQNDKNLVINHSLKLEGKALTPGAVMHFRVKSKDNVNNEGASSDLTFQLTGYVVAIKVSDSQHNPIKDAEVYLYSDPLKSKTNSAGEAVFVNVSPGRHLALVLTKSKNSKQQTTEIEVKEMQGVQRFFLNVDTSADLILSISIYSTILLLIIVLVFAVIIFLRKRKSMQAELPS